MPVGYTRVKTAEQKPDPQHDALLNGGLWRLPTDVASGIKADGVTAT